MSDYYQPRSVRDLYAQASAWAVRGLLIFGMWALTEIYSGLTNRLTEQDKRLNEMAASLARVEAILNERQPR